MGPVDRDNKRSCYACGGEVDEEGNAYGGEVSDEDMLGAFSNEPEDEDTHQAKFAAAIMKKGRK